MATSVVQFNPANLPAFARKREGVSALTKSLAGGEGGGGYSKRISIKGGVFRLIAGGKEIASIDERFLDVVIVNAAPKISRVYYEGKFDPKAESAKPPTCWSNDGDKPAAEVRNKQAAVCANCPQNVRGSGEGESRACRFQQRIAVVLANDMEGDVMQVTLPAKSLFGKEDGGQFPLQAYARWLAQQNIEANEVVTRMRFDTAVESPKVFFKTMRWLTDEEYGVVDEKGQTEDAKKAVEFTVAQMDGVKSKDDDEPFETPKAAAKPAPEPEPAADEEPPAPAPKARKKAAAKAEEVESEPTVRKAAEAPTVPPRKNVAQLAAEWDTDD